MISRLLHAFQEGLAGRRLPLHLALLAVALSLPALAVGWQLDDFSHRVVLLGASVVEVPPLSLYAVLSGDAEVNHRLVDLGVLPWWIPEGFRIAFFRPISAATHWLDYRLWPGSPAPMHLHSLLWLGALVAAVASLYRRLLGAGWVAGLAALLFALDEAHGTPAGWLANRNALLATCFGCLGLLAHDRWRRDGRRWAAVAAPACLALALASGEMALGAFAYLVAYALFLDPAPRWRRLASLLPAGGVLAGWAAFYRLRGYGAWGSGLYVDPLGNPGEFALAFLRRAPLLLLGQWSPIPPEAAVFTPSEVRRVTFGLALVVLALLALLLAPLVRRQGTARFFALGMGLSLVPVVATFPSNRLNLFVGLGAMGLAAQLLAGVWRQEGWRPESRLWRRAAAAAAAALAVTHLVLAPVTLPVTAYSARLFGEPSIRAAVSLPEEAGFEGRDLIVVQAPDYLTFVTDAPAVRHALGLPNPRRMRGLVAAPVAMAVTRLDARRLAVRLGAGLFAGPFGRLFRNERSALAPGKRVELPGMAVEVTSLTPDGQPNGLIFQFPVPLEDPSLAWVRWDDEQFVPFTPPAVGETAHLPAATAPGIYGDDTPP